MREENSIKQFVICLIGCAILFGPLCIVAGVGLREAKTAPPAPKESPTPVPKELQIEGHYLATGKMGENEYESLCSIRQEGELYIVTWNVGGTVGVAMRKGNQLSVGMRAGTSLGVLVYQIERDEKDKPKLVGKWASLPGQPVVHEETLIWLKEVKK